MKKIVILGAGGLGREVAWLIENINEINHTWDILGFIEDESKSYMYGTEVYGYKILGGDTFLLNYKEEIYVICAIGRGSLRKSIYEKVSQYPNVKIATLIDPLITINKTVKVGEGSIICSKCSITLDINIGKGVLLNIGSMVGHDVTIGDYCTFLPHSMAAGNTIFGECCEIGSGAFIFQGIKIFANTTIAPLSAVYKDVTETGIYAGNPARKIK